VLEYSDSIWPLIFISGILLLGIIYSTIALICDICSSGLMVWHRDNLGKMICQIIFHSCLFATLINLRIYMQSKEQRNWKGDVWHDNKMDFYQCFNPLFIATTLYLCKLGFLHHKYTLLKFLMALAVIILVFLGNSLFDKSLNNDAPTWLLAIPISMFLITQAFLDVIACFYTQDIKLRLFYFLDNKQKKWWVAGHLLASIIYSVLLFYWLWVMHNNENNSEGMKEDEKILHVSLSSFIFYAFFLIERVGLYVLDLFQDQFLFEMMK